MRNGKFHITVDFIGNVFRTSTAGASQRNSYALDWVHGLIGYVSVDFVSEPSGFLDVCRRLHFPCGDVRWTRKFSLIAMSIRNTCKSADSLIRDGRVDVVGGTIELRYSLILDTSLHYTRYSRTQHLHYVHCRSRVMSSIHCFGVKNHQTSLIFVVCLLLPTPPASGMQSSLYSCEEVGI